MLCDDKHMSAKDAANLNTLTLAYVGDAVWSLYVRERMTVGHDRKAGQLHVICSQWVCAAAQARFAEQVESLLTEDEHAVYKRGCNANAHHKAKNQTYEDYRKATGMEAVFGYLYLSGNTARIGELLALQSR